MPVYTVIVSYIAEDLREAARVTDSIEAALDEVDEPIFSVSSPAEMVPIEKVLAALSQLEE